ncbi:HNH endonuclease [Desulfosediminicola ganghwensis]|uniref:HNH endonuclease n=1 Tax=Desulfosediminicola ganghwensis TaxID=2569540 RepID=UPI0010AB8438|nr:HNH endonuclease [Desulfosediminicola ganghwensis]
MTCSTLDTYLQAITNLRVDKNKKSWADYTYHCSPYKPFLLLSILDHIASGIITRNFIEPSFELAETFQSYIELLPPTGRKASMALPFYHLERSGFWHMLPREGEVHHTGRSINSVAQLRKIYLAVKLDEDLFKLLQMETSREKIRLAIVEKYFQPPFRAPLVQHALVNQAAKFYSNLLLTTELEVNYRSKDTPPELQYKVRNYGFRQAIVKIYTHRCALCGIKMQTPEGHTVVDAAHIIPWRESQNDNPTNGLALCKLCHWSFDEGLMSVDDKYHVMVSRAVMKDTNLPGHILTLSNRLMFRPQESQNWPSMESFDWHRKKIFRKER